MDWEVPLKANSGGPYVGVSSDQCVAMTWGSAKEQPCAVSSSSPRKVLCDFH